MTPWAKWSTSAPFPQAVVFFWFIVLVVVLQFTSNCILFCDLAPPETWRPGQMPSLPIYNPGPDYNNEKKIKKALMKNSQKLNARLYIEKLNLNYLFRDVIVV